LLSQNQELTKRFTPENSTTKEERAERGKGIPGKVEGKSKFSAFQAGPFAMYEAADCPPPMDEQTKVEFILGRPVAGKIGQVKSIELAKKQSILK
jgi:hypothetical protein